MQFLQLITYTMFSILLEVRQDTHENLMRTSLGFHEVFMRFLCENLMRTIYAWDLYENLTRTSWDFPMDIFVLVPCNMPRGSRYSLYVLMNIYTFSVYSQHARHCGLVVSALAWDGTGCEFDSWQCRIYIPCSLSLRLLGSLRGSLGTYGLTQKWCWKTPILNFKCRYLRISHDYLGKCLLEIITRTTWVYLHARCS